MKKFFCSLMAIFFFLTLKLPVLQAAGGAVGDLNNDQKISLADVILCAKYAIGSQTQPTNILSVADLNSTDNIELGDVLLLARAALGTLDITQTDVQILSPTSTLLLNEQPDYTIDKTIRIEMAQNEGESAQFALYANSRTYQNIRVSISALTNENGDTLPAENVQLYKEYFTAQDYEWTVGKVPTDGKPQTAHALIPMTYEDYNQVSTVAGENTVYQLNVSTQSDTPAGTYTGTVTLNHDAGVITLPVSVTVWDFALPQVPTYRTMYGYWEWMMPSYTGLFGEPLNQMIRDAYDLAADYKLSLSSLPQAIIGSYSGAEEYAQRIKEHLDKTPTQTAYIIPFYYSSDAEGYWYLTEQQKQQNLELYAALEKYGILDRAYIYSNDEPHTEQQYYNMEVINNFLIETGMNEKVHNIVPVTNMGAIQGDTNTWCVVSDVMDFERVEQIKEATGNEFWWYGSATAADIYYEQSYLRMHGLFARQKEMTGGLHWLTNMCGYYIDNPNSELEPGYYFDDVNMYSIGNAAIIIHGLEGDSVLNRNLTVPTLTLTACRDAIEDYDYMVLLEQKVQAFLDETGLDMTLQEAMEAYYSGLSVSFTEFATEQAPNNIITMRRHIAETILNGADYIMTQQTLENGYRFNQKIFTLYVRPGTEANLPQAELMNVEKGENYDTYTFLYTHQQACEDLTVVIGNNTYIRPIQMSLSISGEPQEMFKANQQLLQDSNKNIDVLVTTDPDGSVQIDFAAQKNTLLSIPKSLTTVEDITAYSHIGTTLTADFDCKIAVMINTNRDSVRIVEATLTAGETKNFFVQLPTQINLKTFANMRISILEADGQGTISLYGTKLVQKPEYSSKR